MADLMSRRERQYRGRAGRPKNSDLQKLRVQLWYHAVKSRGNWTDYRLDMRFGQAEGPIVTDGSGRTRVFSVIRKKASIPCTGNHHHRTFDLVERVESDPNFRGTRSIIRSIFWDLLELPPADLKVSRSFVSTCLEQLNLTRLSDIDALDWVWYMSEELFRVDRGSLKSGGASPYEACLVDATKGLPLDLDLLALFGGLFREACLSCNLKTAEIAQILFCISLEQFCSQQWLGEHAYVLFDLAKNRILYGKKGYFPTTTPTTYTSPVVFDEIESRGFIVAADNPKLNYFRENREEISMAFRYYLSTLPTS